MRIRILQSYVNDLSDQNRVLVGTVEDLEHEANERVATLDSKLQRNATIVKVRFSVIRVFTRCQFWPSGIVVACLCLCVRVRVCINHLLVRVITWDRLKLGSPNLHQRCETPWFRSLLYWEAIDLDFQGQI